MPAKLLMRNRLVMASVGGYTGLTSLVNLTIGLAASKASVSGLGHGEN